MQVTLWRHGEAGLAPTDDQRELTERGAEHVSVSATWFRDWCFESGTELPGHCRYSPLCRTRQTASLLNNVLAFHSLLAHEHLMPERSDYVHGGFLDEQVGHQLVVGHNPYLSQLIAVWCDTSAYRGLSPGGFATIDLLAPTRGGGELLHYAPEGFL